MAGVAAPAAAQDAAAERLLQSVAKAMGGIDRLRAIDNFVLTGFGQRVYQDGGGNSDVRAPGAGLTRAEATDGA